MPDFIAARKPKKLQFLYCCSSFFIQKFFIIIFFIVKYTVKMDLAIYIDAANNVKTDQEATTWCLQCAAALRLNSAADFATPAWRDAHIRVAAAVTSDASAGSWSACVQYIARSPTTATMDVFGTAAWRDAHIRVAAAVTSDSSAEIWSACVQNIATSPTTATKDVFGTAAWRDAHIRVAAAVTSDASAGRWSACVQYIARSPTTATKDVFGTAAWRDAHIRVTAALTSNASAGSWSGWVQNIASSPTTVTKDVFGTVTYKAAADNAAWMDELSPKAKSILTEQVIMTLKDLRALDQDDCDELLKAVPMGDRAKLRKMLRANPLAAPPLGGSTTRYGDGIFGPNSGALDWKSKGWVPKYDNVEIYLRAELKRDEACFTTPEGCWSVLEVLDKTAVLLQTVKSGVYVHEKSKAVLEIPHEWRKRIAGLATQHIFVCAAYTAESVLYKDMNRAMRENVKELLERYRHLIFFLDGALSTVEQLPPGLMFRGIDRILDTYTVGIMVTWQAFSSASQDPAVPLRFMNEKGTFFVINANKAKCIHYLSHSPSEKEAIFAPNTVFKVNEVHCGGMGASAEHKAALDKYVPKASIEELMQKGMLRMDIIVMTEI